MNDTTNRMISERAQKNRQSPSTAQRQNISQTEQWVSMLAGGGLVLYGLSRGSLWGLVSAAAGASLVYRGWSGHCTTYELLGVCTAGHRN